MVLYFDPDRKVAMWSKSVIPIFAIIFYMLPQEPALAIRLWTAICTSLGLSDKKKKLPNELRNPRALILPLLLAVELGDDVVAAKIRPVLNTFVDGRFFDSTGKDTEQDFGYFFFLNEKFPRGQLSALLCCLEVLQPGSWQRAFHNAHDRSRFSAPRVTKSAWPAVGISRAFNDKDRLLVTLRNLSLSSNKTSIDIENLGDDFTVRVNGTTWSNWKRLDSGHVRVFLTLPKTDLNVEISGTGWCGDKTSKDDWKPISIHDFHHGSMI